MGIDRKAMKEQLRKRTEESNKNTDPKQNNKFEYYLDLPPNPNGEEGETFPIYSIYKKCKDLNKVVEHFFNIVPFKVGSKYPTANYSFSKGSWTYYLDLWVHKNVGPENKKVVCPNRNYGKRCPICEHQNELLKEAQTKEERREIYLRTTPTRHSIYFIRVSQDDKTNNEEYNKGVQIMDVAYNWMEGELQKVATNPRGGGIESYADIDEGLEIMVRCCKLGEGKYKVDGHKLLKRDYVIEDEEIAQTFPLDECVKLLPYDKIAAIYYGEDEEPELEEPEEPGVIEEEIKTEEDVPIFQNEDVCPVGGTWAVDFDKLVDCSDCKVDMDCRAAKKKLAAAKKEEPKPTTPKRKRPQIMEDDVSF